MKKIVTAAVLLLSVVLSDGQIINPNGKSLEFVNSDQTLQVKMGFRFQNLLTVEESTGQFFSDPTVNALVRRARLKFDGYLLDTNFTFKFEMGMSNRDIGARNDFEQVNSSSRLILDAVAKYKVLPGMELWFGQTKLPGNRERVVSSNDLQFVDRSLLNSAFNIDRDMGFQVRYQRRMNSGIIYGLIGSVSMGEGRNITIGNQGGLDYTGRIELLPLGAFAKKGDYFESDLSREKNHKLALGATFDYNDNASRQRGQLGKYTMDTSGNVYYTDLRTLFFDIHYKYRGISVLFEYADKISTKGMKPGENQMLVDPATRFLTGNAGNIQVGYLFANNTEIATRFTMTRPDNDQSAVSETNEYTLGFSKFLIGHKLKIQTDMSLTDRFDLADPVLRYRFQVEFGF